MDARHVCDSGGTRLLSGYHADTLIVINVHFYVQAVVDILIKVNEH